MQSHRLQGPIPASPLCGRQVQLFRLFTANSGGAAYVDNSVNSSSSICAEGQPAALVSKPWFPQTGSGGSNHVSSAGRGMVSTTSMMATERTVMLLTAKETVSRETHRPVPAGFPPSLLWLPCLRLYLLPNLPCRAGRLLLRLLLQLGSRSQHPSHSGTPSLLLGGSLRLPGPSREGAPSAHSTGHRMPPGPKAQSPL